MYSQVRAEHRECVQCLDGDESRRASVELGIGLRQGDERLLGLSNILHTAWLPGWQNAYNTLGSEASVDALRFCGSDRGGPRQAVCIHRYARVRASKSKEGAKPVVRETSLHTHTHYLLTYLRTSVYPQGSGAVELRAISLHLP